MTPPRNRRPAVPDPAAADIRKPTPRRVTKAPKNVPGILPTEPPAPTVAAKPAPESPTDASPPPVKKVSQNMYWESQLLDRLRSASVMIGVFHPESGVGSMSEIMNEAVRRYLPELEAAYNNGKPFDRIPGQVPKGRRRRT